MKCTFSINNGLNSVELFIVYKYKLRKDLSVLIFTLNITLSVPTRDTNAGICK